MIRSLLALVLGLVIAEPALAGACDAAVRRGANARGDALVTAWQEVLRRCDSDRATAAFDTFMRASGEVGVLVRMSTAAIDTGLYPAIWGMMERLPYDVRGDVAEGIGEQCTDSEHGLPFLQGAYYGLRPVQFTQWGPALRSCELETLTSWLNGLVIAPPATTYDEKYNTVLDAYVRRQRVDSLPALKRAAVEAANGGGPFNLVIDQLEVAIQPADFGARPSADDRARANETLVAIANAVGPEQAALVADRLYHGGAPDLAASLLPRVYPARVQDGGSLLYGVAAIEQCDDSVMIHWAAVSEPARRWSIRDDVEGPARAFRARLRCQSESPWEVLTTGEPVASNADLRRWADELVEQYSARGLNVRAREQRRIELD